MPRRKQRVRSCATAIRLKRAAPDQWEFYFSGYRDQPAERWDITRRKFAFGVGVRYVARSAIRPPHNPEDHHTLADVRAYIAKHYEWI